MATRGYEVHYAVTPPERFTRLELAMRFVAFLALGTLGLSFSAIFLFAYLALPVIAVTRLGAGRDPGAYVRDDGPLIISALRWFAAASAWAGLTANRLPLRSPDETVSLTVEGTAHPTARSAAWRLISGIPSALVLALIGWVGVFVWIWAALTVLVSQRVGQSAFDYLVGVQRWTLRLLVYQASLVDEYPPFSLGDTPHGGQSTALNAS